MKTLKKSLCLVLALVMVLSMGVISASADLDYEDVEDITYAEAVDVMSGIGVLEGYTDGTFLATKEVTRAEAAKIIAYLMIGDSREADALKTTSDPFSDVSKNHWAAGYIAYLVQEGVLDGVGGGKFDPNGKVTGLAFAKMLLTALGYGVNDEYVGENWSIRTAKDAINYGIFDDNLSGANNEAATREECALYAFNTLDMSKVTYSALLGNYITNADWWDNAESNKEDTFANDFKLKRTTYDDGDTDAFYRPVGYYWYVGKMSNKISDVYGADEYLVATYTTPVSANELYSLLGKKTLTSAKEFNVYRDGVDGSDSEGFDLDDVLARGGTLDSTGYGVQTYVYYFPETYDVKGNSNDDAEIRICIINTFLAEVDNVEEETKSSDPETTVKTGYGWMTKDTYATDEYAEGDYVLITYSARTNAKGEHAGIQSMVPATLIEAEIEKYTNTSRYTKVTASGTTYTAAAKDTMVDSSSQTAASAMSKSMVGTEYVLVIDEYGYLIGVIGIAIPDNYVYVAQFGVKNNSSAESVTDTVVMAAHLYYADGTNAIVTVDTSSKNDSGAYLTDAAIVDAFVGEQGYKASHEMDAINALNKDAYGNNGALGIYKLTMKNDKAILSSDGLYEFPSSPTITKGISRFESAAAGSNYATTKTLFFYVSGSYNAGTLSVVPYVGINKVPVAKTGEAVAEQGYWKLSENSDNWIYHTMLVKSDFTVADGSTVYFYDGYYTKSGKTVTYYLYNGTEEVAIDYTYKTYGAADDAIDSALSIAGSYVVESATGLKAHTCGGSDKIKHVEDAVINNLNTVEEVYETTMFVDVTGAMEEYYIENAEIVDLTGSNIKTVSNLSKALEKAQAADKSIEVCFSYSGSNNEVAVIYVTAIK